MPEGAYSVLAASASERAAQGALLEFRLPIGAYAAGVLRKRMRLEG